MSGAGTHSNGYCRRFSLHSLFIPLRAIGDSETFATANIQIFFNSVSLIQKNTILYFVYFTVMNHAYPI